MPYASVTRNGATLLCFPPGDLALARLSLRLLDELAELTPDALELLLKPYYPNVAVRPRDGLAALGPSAGGKTWYVYRDGRFSPYAENGEWWAGEGVARLVLSADGHYLDANDAALALLNVELGTLTNELRSGDFTTEEAGRNVAWLLTLLQETGVLHSTAVLVPWGARQPHGVEFRMLWDGDGPGRHVSFMREIPIEAARATLAPAEPSEEVA